MGLYHVERDRILRLYGETCDQVRILILVGQQGSDSITAAAISERLAIPLMQVKKLVAWLVRAQLLRSIMGRNGGVRLAASTFDMPIGRLITSLEEADQGLTSRDPLGKVLRIAFSAWVASLDHHTLGDLARVDYRPKKRS